MAHDFQLSGPTAFLCVIGILVAAVLVGSAAAVLSAHPQMAIDRALVGFVIFLFVRLHLLEAQYQHSQRLLTLPPPA